MDATPLEGQLERAEGVIGSGFHGAKWQAEQLGDLALFAVLQEVQLKHLPMLRAQCLQGVADRQPLDEVLNRVAACRLVLGFRLKRPRGRAAPQVDREATGDRDAIVVAGASTLAEALRRELGRGARPGAVREGSLAGAAGLVYVVASAVTEDDETLLEAHRRGVPIVAVVTDPGFDARIPHVLATDIVRVPAGSGFPVDEIARVLARKLGEAGTTVAARVPAVRRPVCEELIASFSRTNAVLGAAVFVRGADLPVLTLNQLRMTLRIGLAHGVEIERERLPEIVAVIGSALGLRKLARRVLPRAPISALALKAAIAYGGTRAIGEAAMRYFEAVATDRPPETRQELRSSA